MAIEKFIHEKRITEQRPHTYEVRWIEDGQERTRQFSTARESYAFSARIVGELPAAKK